MKSVYSMYSSGIAFDKTSSASVAVRTLATWSWKLETRSKKSHYVSIHSTSQCSAKCWWKSNQIKTSRLQPCCDSESRPKESALYFPWCPGAFLAQVEKTALPWCFGEENMVIPESQAHLKCEATGFHNTQGPSQVLKGLWLPGYSNIHHVWQHWFVEASENNGLETIEFVKSRVSAGWAMACGSAVITKDHEKSVYRLIWLHPAATPATKQRQDVSYGKKVEKMHCAGPRSIVPSKHTRNWMRKLFSFRSVSQLCRKFTLP